MVNRQAKRNGGLLALGALLFWMVTAVGVQAAEGQVLDDAGMLEVSEAEALQERLNEMEEASGWEAYIFTTEDAGGSTTMSYGEKRFDEVAQGMDGVAFVIDMDNREIAVVTFGEAVRYLTDDRIDEILDKAYERVSEEEYYGCLETMVSMSMNAYNAGIPGGQYNYDEETGKRDYAEENSLSLAELLVSLLAAAAAGIGFFFSVKGKYQLHFGQYRYNYHENASLRLGGKEDRMVNRIVTHRRIPRDTPSGGGGSGRSSTHSGAGGRTVGGGSRKF